MAEKNKKMAGKKLKKWPEKTKTQKCFIYSRTHTYNFTLENSSSEEKSLPRSV
jgi:hypothetical protein